MNEGEPCGSISAPPVIELRGTPELAFLPAVSLSAGQLVEFEALLRWRDPGGEMVSPTVVLPEAEASGDMPVLHGWVLTEACMQASTWGRGIQLAVNCSTFELRRGGAASAVAEALAKSGFDPARLTIEVTELALIDMRATRDLLAVLRLGVRLAIDDVAWGWSPADLPLQMSIHALKIDQPLTSNIDGRGGASTRGAVEAIVLAGQSAGMAIVAEGVERVTQAELLREIGVDFAQGYYFARPCRADQARELASMDPPPTFPRDDVLAQRQRILQAQRQIRMRPAVATPGGALRPIGRTLAKATDQVTGVASHGRSSKALEDVAPSGSALPANAEHSAAMGAVLGTSPDRSSAGGPSAKEGRANPAAREHLPGPLPSAAPDFEEAWAQAYTLPPGRGPIPAAPAAQSASSALEDRVTPSLGEPAKSFGAAPDVPHGSLVAFEPLQAGNGSFVAMEVLDALRGNDEKAGKKKSADADLVDDDVVVIASDRTKLSRRRRAKADRS